MKLSFPRAPKIGALTLASLLAAGQPKHTMHWPHPAPATATL